MNMIALRAQVATFGRPVEHPPVWPRLAELTMPVAILDGALDCPKIPVVGRAAADLLPDATHEVLPGVAHLPTLERPDDVARVIRGVVARPG